jgi:hypothetical protein
MLKLTYRTKACHRRHPSEKVARPTSRIKRWINEVIERQSSRSKNGLVSCKKQLDIKNFSACVSRLRTAYLQAIVS